MSERDEQTAKEQGEQLAQEFKQTIEHLVEIIENTYDKQSKQLGLAKEAIVGLTLRISDSAWEQKGLIAASNEYLTRVMEQALQKGKQQQLLQQMREQGEEKDLPYT